MTVAGQLRRNILIVSFFFSLQTGLLLFFNSSFLAERGFSDQAIGIVLGLGYVAALLLAFAVPSLLRSFGERRALTATLALTGLVFLAVSFSTGFLATALLVPLALALSNQVYILMDIFLATVSGDIHKVAGRRGLYITILHVGLIIAQLLAGYVLGSSSFSLLYAWVGATLLILAAAAHVLMNGFRDASYSPADWPQIWRNLARSPNIRNTFLIQFVLRIFYAIMIIYTPVYLHEHIGIPLESMGVIFAVMLIPFLILEIPVGRLEDSEWHERDVLIVGLSLAALATASLVLIATPSIAIWAAALFATRVGAALIEISNEAYFFKHIHGSDSGDVSAYRMVSPVASIAGPLLGAALLFVLPLQFIFIALAAILLLGIIPASALKDAF